MFTSNYTQPIVSENNKFAIMLTIIFLLETIQFVSLHHFILLIIKMKCHHFFVFYF